MSDASDDQQVAPLPPLGDASHLSSSPARTQQPRQADPGRAPESPVALIMVGLFVAVVLGGFLALAGSSSDVGVLVLLGYLAGVIGSVTAAVGVIAAGVRLGMRWAAYDNRP